MKIMFIVLHICRCRYGIDEDSESAGVEGSGRGLWEVSLFIMFMALGEKLWRW